MPAKGELHCVTVSYSILRGCFFEEQSMSLKTIDLPSNEQFISLIEKSSPEHNEISCTNFPYATVSSGHLDIAPRQPYLEQLVLTVANNHAADKAMTDHPSKATSY